MVILFVIETSSYFEIESINDLISGVINNKQTILLKISKTRKTICVPAIILFFNQQYFLIGLLYYICFSFSLGIQFV